MSKKKIPRVDEWMPTSEDSLIKYDGKLIIAPFDKIFNKPAVSILNTFNIIKNSYVAKLDMITNYINYFIKYYDEDNELLVAYLKLKAFADNKGYAVATRRDSLDGGLSRYIQYVYHILMSESIQNKINKMVEDNYYLDIESKDDKQYSVALEFTTHHAEILMRISIAMKLMIPPMFHYINKMKVGLDRMRTKTNDQQYQFTYKDYIFRFYQGLFEVFSDDDVDIYNKLWLSCCSRINVHHNSNKLTWEQRVIYATTPATQTQEMFKDRIVCETMFQYVFNKNIIAFNHVILRNQLTYFSYERYSRNRIELSHVKDADGLSGLDKLEMNLIKLDESVSIMSDVNIKETIKYIANRMHMKVKKKEIRYYMEHVAVSKFQVQLCHYFYAKEFGGYRDLVFLSKHQYFKLIILLKRRLRAQGMIYLPEILTANIEGRLNARTIRNDKFLSKIKASDLYNEIVENKYSELNETGNNTILNILSTLINTKFRVVDYDNPDKLGELIEVNQDVISDEFLSFVNQI